MSEADSVLCLNAGSSSLKFALFRGGDRVEACVAEGSIERIGSPDAHATLKADGTTTERACPDADADVALAVAFDLLDSRGLSAPSVVGHRVVHGGPRHLRPARITPALLAELQQLIPLAPLHLPAGILGMKAALARLPNIPHVACFDTSFHAHMPEYALRFPLPERLYEAGVRRYGFHGLSYEYVLSTLGSPPPSRLVIAHLGNGASLAAIKDGVSVDTTMGFTPAGGIMMGTRAGDLDPGLLLYLMREQGYSSEQLEALVDRESGLLGVGGSADMRSLSERQGQDPKARLAIVMMGYSVRKTIGAYMAVLGGLDLLVFTGGIGEHSAALREEACLGLSALGLTLDARKNAAHSREIHAPGSCRVLVVATDEDRMIARHALELLRATPTS